VTALSDQPIDVPASRPAATTDTAPFRLLVILTAALVVLGGVVWFDSGESLTLLGCAAGLVILSVYKFDYLHPAVVFLAPWLTILFFSTIPISEYARDLDVSTCRFLLITVFVWLLATIAAPVMPSRPADSGAPPRVRGGSDNSRTSLKNGVTVGFVVLYLFAALNVAFAGYIPIVSLLTTGDSRYFEFGVPSIYGAFLAYANAVACLAAYAYLRERQRTYLWLFLSVLCIHVLFMTRLSAVVLLAEGFVIRSLAVRRVSRLSIVAFMSLGLIGFAALGELRSGDIGATIRVAPSFTWMPNSLLWLYAYSYFNVLNLDNMLTFSAAPYYDGSLWQNLLPSVLRPNIDHGAFVEIEALNVSSYIFPTYMDAGAVGVIVWTAFWGLATSYVYRRALRAERFVDIATYACLFCCALLSFFANEWVTLPVIFQIIFFRIFHFVLFRGAGRGPPATNDGVASACGGFQK
jgi:oligosaccharide repeat unit polymerase